jgi:hypothetical protein
MLLAEAKAGHVRALATIQVRGAGQFAPHVVGDAQMEFCAGAVCLLHMIGGGWVSQIMQQVAAVQQRGLQRATPADFSRLPGGLLGRS